MSTILRTLASAAVALTLLVVGCTDATTGPDGKPWPDDVPLPPGIPERERIYPSIAIQYYVAGACVDSVRLVVDGDPQGRNVAARAWGHVQIIAEPGTSHRFSVRRAGTTTTAWGPFTVTRDTVIIMRCP